MMPNPLFLPRSRIALIVGSAVLSSVDANQVRAQDGATLPPAVARHMAASDRIQLDGLLDEAVWQAAPVSSGFRQQEPDEGAPATERTEVRVVYDEATLYVGITAYDSDPDAVIARVLQRDRVMRGADFGRFNFTTDDGVAILFDTFHDHRNAMIFATNPNGAEFDALISDEGREVNVDWRGVWRVAAKRTADGWSAEFAIPFRTLRYPSNAATATWGFNVFRSIRRKNEDVLWRSWSRNNEGFNRVSRAGHLEGLDDLPRTGVNLELKPYVLGGAAQARNGLGGLDADGQLDVGFDAKYEIRPGLVLDATLNTDFAQVEADDEQVNLTRFSLFFPEKRDFFLENSGIFDFGERGFFGPPPYLLFFSRRIGIAPEGEVPVLGGLRLTGRVGSQRVGALNVVTDDAFGRPKTNFAVVRVKRDIGTNNFIGALVTDRRTSEGWNTTGGVDWSFWPTSRLVFRGFASATATSGAGGEGSAFQGQLDYTSNHFGFNIAHLSISPNARADMGFITRTDVRQSTAFFRVTPRPHAVGLRKVDFFWFNRLITRTDGTLQDWSIGPSLSPQWNSGESMRIEYEIGFTRLDQGFEIGEGVPVPAGDYDTWLISASAETSSNRPVVLQGNTRFQSIYDGHISTVGGSLTLSPSANLSTVLSYTHNRVDVPNGAFDADIGSLRLTLAFTTQITANALIQYNERDDELSANIRFNFIHTPGSDLFIVLNEQRGTSESLWDLNTRSTVVKVTYLARL
ncbi:MAG: carbohydrate binding family 9 domain-containing protein [Gemmatimonadetes bacterium]|nr:carbohydrate binding family 9 domain-containing protein [Gemmatimonadota bacterium]